jgi:hypothetical protein
MEEPEILAASQSRSNNTASHSIHTVIHSFIRHQLGNLAKGLDTILEAGDTAANKTNMGLNLQVAQSLMRGENNSEAIRASVRMEEKASSIRMPRIKGFTVWRSGKRTDTQKVKWLVQGHTALTSLILLKHRGLSASSFISVSQYLPPCIAFQDLGPGNLQIFSLYFPGWSWCLPCLPPDCGQFKEGVASLSSSYVLRA